MSDESSVTSADREKAREAIARLCGPGSDPLDRVDLYALGLAAGRAGPTWTATPPTEECFCFWRESASAGEPTFVDHWTRDDDGVLRTGELDYRETVEGVLSRYPRSQWCPIPAPQEPT